MTDAVQPERNRDLARDHPDNRHRDGVGRHPPAGLEKILRVLFFGDIDAAGATADQHAGSWFVDAQAGIVPRFGGGNDGDQRSLRIPPRVGTSRRFNQPGRNERRVLDADLRHRGRDSTRERRGIEVGNRTRAAAAAAHVVPEPLASDAEGRDNADAGDCDARSCSRCHDLYNRPRLAPPPFRVARRCRIRGLAGVLPLRLPRALWRARAVRC